MFWECSIQVFRRIHFGNDTIQATSLNSTPRVNFDKFQIRLQVQDVYYMIYYTIQLFPCFTSCLSSTNGQKSHVCLLELYLGSISIFLANGVLMASANTSLACSALTNANMWAGVAGAAWMPPLASCSPGLQGASAVLPGLCSKVSITECHTGNLQCRGNLQCHFWCPQVCWLLLHTGHAK